MMLSPSSVALAASPEQESESSPVPVTVMSSVAVLPTYRVMSDSERVTVTASGGSASRLKKLALSPFQRFAARLPSSSSRCSSSGERVSSVIAGASSTDSPPRGPVSEPIFCDSDISRSLPMNVSEKCSESPEKYSPLRSASAE